MPLLNLSQHVNFGHKLIHSCKVVKEWQVQSLEHPTVFFIDFRELEEVIVFQFSQTYKFKGPCSTKSLEVKICVDQLLVGAIQSLITFEPLTPQKNYAQFWKAKCCSFPKLGVVFEAIG